MEARRWSDWAPELGGHAPLVTRGAAGFDWLKNLPPIDAGAPNDIRISSPQSRRQQWAPSPATHLTHQLARRRPDMGLPFDVPALLQAAAPYEPRLAEWLRGGERWLAGVRSWLELVWRNTPILPSFVKRWLEPVWRNAPIIQPFFVNMAARRAHIGLAQALVDG